MGDDLGPVGRGVPAVAPSRPVLHRLTARDLNRATLARQLLLTRVRLDPDAAISRVVALQAQAPASPYLALWTRIADFDPTHLDAMITSRLVVKATLMRDARARLDQVDVDARVARDLVKATYTRTIGGFAARHLAERPWHRPDWRHAIIATARSNVLRRVHTIGEQAGVWPITMLIDAVLYVSDVACPVCAWPGDPKLLGRGLGLHSPYGSAELAGHAQFLTGHDYKGTAALTAPGAWLTEHGCQQHRPPGDQ